MLADFVDQKVRFVSGHHGTTAFETITVVTVTLSWGMLHRILLSTLRHAAPVAPVALWTVEVALLVVPVLLAFTLPHLVTWLHTTAVLLGTVTFSLRSSPLCQPNGLPTAVTGHRLD
eukprot:RCo012105